MRILEGIRKAREATGRRKEEYAVRAREAAEFRKQFGKALLEQGFNKGWGQGAFAEIQRLLPCENRDMPRPAMLRFTAPLTQFRFFSPKPEHVKTAKQTSEFLDNGLSEKLPSYVCFNADPHSLVVCMHGSRVRMFLHQHLKHQDEAHYVELSPEEVESTAARLLRETSLAPLLHDGAVYLTSFSRENGRERQALRAQPPTR